MAAAGQTDFTERGSLPEAYGTGELVLRARDPHWLYAHWDLSREHQRRYNALSADGRLALRVYREEVADAPVEELRVHPESQHWFVHVRMAGVRYVAELGYYRPDGAWVTVSRSDSAPTPPEDPSADDQVRWATVTPTSQLQRVSRAATAQAAVEHLPQTIKPESLPEASPPPQPSKVEAMVGRPEANEDSNVAAERYEDVAFNPVLPPQLEVERTGSPASTSAFEPQFVAVPLPALEGIAPDYVGPQIESTAAPAATPRGPASHPVPAARSRPALPPEEPVTQSWTITEERELLELVFGAEAPQQQGLSSEQMAGAQKLVRKAGLPEITSPPGAAPAAPAQPPEVVSISSPAGPEKLRPDVDFWFQVNAELVIYGATEPTATVSISGRRIRLRPDGTFSYRFALPDGSYALDVRAESTQGDARNAALQFSRETQHRGVVGRHPQNPALKPPLPESIP